MRRLSLLALTCLLAACGENGPFSAPITITLNPALLTLTPGQAASVTLTTTAAGSAVANPDVTLPEVPAGLDASSTGQTLTVAAKLDATAGLYTVPVKVTAPGGAGHATLTVQVQPSGTPNPTPTPAPGFSIAATPAAVTVAQGTQTQVGVTITPDATFTAPVTLTGITGTTSDLKATVSGQGVLLDAASTTVPGTYVLTLTASGGGQTRSASLTVTVIKGASS